MKLFDKILLNCREATYLHEKKREGKLDRWERFGVWFHLLYCRFCKLFVKQVEQIEYAASNLGREEPPGFQLSPARKAALQQEMNERLKN